MSDKYKDLEGGGDLGGGGGGGGGGTASYYSESKGVINNTRFSFFEELFYGNEEFTKYRKSEFAVHTFHVLNGLIAIYLIVLIASILLYFELTILTELVLVWFFGTAAVGGILSILYVYHKYHIDYHLPAYRKGRYNQILTTLTLVEKIYLCALTLTVNLHIAFISSYSTTSVYNDYGGATPGQLPESIVIAALLLPSVLYLVLKNIRFLYTLIAWASTLIIIIVLLIYYQFTKSIVVLVVAALFCLFILFEFHRQTWCSFLVTNKLEEYIVENHRMHEEIQQNEMGHMLGNVAHDLKTPLCSFISGVEMIGTVMQELSVYCQQRDEPTIPKDILNPKLSTLSEVLVNMTNINALMMMTINRCIDYRKIVNGIKLIPNISCITLSESVQVPLQCIKNLQDTVEVELLPIPNSISFTFLSDKEWLQENLLCLLANAVKYSYRTSEEDESTQKNKVTLQISLVSYHKSKHSPYKPTTNKTGKVPTISCSSRRIKKQDIPQIDIPHIDIPHIDNSYDDADESISPPSHREQIEFEMRKKPAKPAAHSPSSLKLRLLQKILAPNSMKSSRILLHHSSSDHWSANASLGGANCSSSFSLQPYNEPLNGLQEEDEADHDEEKQLLLFEVEDFGPGMTSVQEIQNLFYPNKQANRLTGGTGLGLYSLACRIEALGGSYGVKSRKDGQRGSCFWFAIPYFPQTVQISDLPLQNPPSTSQVGSPRQQEAHPNQSNQQQYFRINTTPTIDSANFPSIQIMPSMSMSYDAEATNAIGTLKILIVDDSIVILKMAAQLLQRNGHTVVTATNGKEGIEKIKESFQETPVQPFNVILMDFQMPIMNGLEAIKEIRELEQSLFIYPDELPPLIHSNPSSPKHLLTSSNGNHHHETNQEPSAEASSSSALNANNLTAEVFQARKFSNYRNKNINFVPYTISQKASFFRTTTTSEIFQINEGNSHSHSHSHSHSRSTEEQIPLSAPSAIENEGTNNTEIIHFSSKQQQYQQNQTIRELSSGAASSYEIPPSQIPVLTLDSEANERANNNNATVKPTIVTRTGILRSSFDSGKRDDDSSHVTSNHTTPKNQPLTCPTTTTLNRLSLVNLPATIPTSQSAEILNHYLRDSQNTIRSSLSQTGQLLRVRHIIIGFSAKSESESIQQGFDLGMDEFMPKPFTLKTFYELYLKIIHSRELLLLSATSIPQQRQQSSPR